MQSHKLTGKVKTWSLSEKPADGERYFMDHLPYGLFRKYAQVELYNPETNVGEQRVGKDRHVGRLKSVIANNDYTPQCFNVSVTDSSIVNIDDKGNVTLPLYEDNKLAILDGGTRFAALESIRASNDKNAKMIDALPIPVIVYLDPAKRKANFLNLNNGTKVNNSHKQAMTIATGRLKADKLDLFRRASDLVKLLNTNEFSPLNEKITYGQTDETGKIQFSQVVTDHKASLIGSLFGSVKILNAIEYTDDAFKKLFIDLYELFEERTDYIEVNKLLALPPDGAKGNVANWISLVNITLYYLYLRNEVNQLSSVDDNASHIIDSAKIYDDLVNGDISRKRRVLLSQGFAQRLFASLEEDSAAPCGFHFGLPIPLLVLTSESSFGVEMLPAVRKSKAANAS